MYVRLAYLLLLGILMTSFPALAQHGCRQPTITPTPAGANIFTDEQEVDLGDAMAQQMEPRLRVTDDPQVTAYLAQVGDRIVKHLPPSHLHFRYYLVDLAVPNAFSVAGGRIYVARKLVAFAKSEDELAGVLGHEMGHIVTHQQAVDMTALFRTVLGVHQVTDRRDIFAKYTDLWTSWRRNPKAFRALSKHGDEHQGEADRVGLEAVTAAGYNPQGLPDFFDRLTESGGYTGSWLSNFLRATPPDARRLREMLKGVESLTQACSKERPTEAGTEFQAWQTAVIEYTGWKRREVLDGLLSKVQLEPLRASLSHVKFSPDGRYILAQDVDKIYVLSREPLAHLFSIDALGAQQALFTPDSQSVVWHNSSLHVEKWDIQTQKRVSVYELVVPKGCTRTALAAEGKTVACEGTDSTLRLLDVATSKVVFEKKDFKPVSIQLGPGVIMVVFGMAFSPDGRYFLAGNRDAAFGFDTKERAEFSVGGKIKRIATLGFVFVGSDRLFGWDSETRHQADLVSFPDGKVLWHSLLAPTTFASVTRGNYVLLSRPKDEGVNVMDLSTQRSGWGYKQRALDVYEKVFAAELRNAELGLTEITTGNILASVKLPGGDLTAPDVAAVTGDLKWAAISEKKRGTIWNLETGKAAYLLREFQGAYLDRDAFYGDFPKYWDTPRCIGMCDLARHRLETLREIKDEHAQQHGRYLLVTQPAKNAPLYALFDRNVTREIRDVLNGQTLWTRHFPKEAPSLAVEPVEDTMNLMWRGDAAALKEELENFPKLAEKLAAAKDKKWLAFVEVVDARSGKPIQAVLVDTNRGSIQMVDHFSVGDWLVFTDPQGQVLVYSYSKGEKVGQVMGTIPAVSKASGLMCVRSNPDQLALYDLASMELRREYSFSSPVAFKEFSQDGKRLLVVTADQTAYQLDLSSLTEAALEATATPRQ
jgi:WD40 repeat protein